MFFIFWYVNLMINTYFVTGTDTSVGKSLVTAALLHKAVRAGGTAYGLKPVAAGCSQVEGQWRNEDALLLQEYSNVLLPYEQVNPVALPAAIAPHIAASLENKRLQLDRLEGFCRGALMRKADLRLIEGAGGWRVPLNAQENLAQLAQRLQTPVILVVGMRLGCLNHALLTAEAIIRDGLTLAGWVANTVDPDMAALEENVQTLQSLLPCPLLGQIPWMAQPSVPLAAEKIHWP